MQTIAFDPGFGNTKAAFVNGKLTTISLPSVVGVGQTDVGLLSVGTSPRRRLKLPSCVQFEGVSYLVGENVAQFARPVERMDFRRLSDGPELRALFYTALHRLLGAGCHSGIRVMVGLPVEVMNNRQLALQTRRELRSWMIGEHDYTIGHPNHHTNYSCRSDGPTSRQLFLLGDERTRRMATFRRLAT